MRALDLMGERFGRLEVVRQSESRKGGSILWECLCECGTTCLVRSSCLTRPNGTKSCGCRSHRTPNDISGRRFGRLIAISLAPKRVRRVTFWNCQCDCGNATIACYWDLMNGNTVSCGCRQRETQLKHGHNRKGSRSSEYGIWSAMKQRCLNPKAKRYADYGGRGITVSQEWMAFEGFFADMGPRPSVEHSIERVDVNKGYCKENCTWATDLQQRHNRRKVARLDQFSTEELVGELRKRSALQ